jgi:hypothetical protein
VSQAGQQVESAAVDLMEDNEMYANTMSDDAGLYGFSTLPAHADYMVKPFKNDDTKEGVSTLDLIAIQKHLLGIQEFDSPYKFIAADVNNSESVSALDLIQLRKIILGVFTEFPDNTSWRFVPESFNFVDPASPWPFEESILYTDVVQSMTEADFVGVKVGDVNGSFIAGAQVVVTRSADDPAYLRVEDRYLTSGEVVTLPVHLDAVGGSISGFQFALHSDALRWTGLQSGESLRVGEENYHVGKTHFAASWHNVQPVREENAVFLLTFEVVQDGRLSEMLHLDRTSLTPEVYTEDLAIRPLALSFGNEEQKRHTFALFQNTPNPWSGETTIGFELPADLLVTLQVYDATGRTILELNQSGNTGYNEITIEDEFIDATSIMYYRLTAGEYSATKKMVLWK